MKLVNKIIVIIIWAVAIYLWIAKGFWYIAAGVFAMHLVEVFVKGVAVGTKAGKSKLFSVVMTLIFGFTWWLPLQNELESTKK